MKINVNGVSREMTPEEIAEIQRESAKMPVTKSNDAVKTKRISREDFELLDVQDEDTIYYIIEEDGTVTVRKGE